MKIEKIINNYSEIDQGDKQFFLDMLPTMSLDNQKRLCKLILHKESLKNFVIEYFVNWKDENRSTNTPSKNTGSPVQSQMTI
jgi:hypothetical protein